MGGFFFFRDLADLLTHLMHPMALVSSCGVVKLGNQSAQAVSKEQAGPRGESEGNKILTP
jgi:hypothetical protein